MVLSYEEKLQDPRWQKKRLEIFERDGWACRECHHTDRTLCVHHLKYLPDTEPWDYPDHLLRTLCSSCHNLETILRSDVEKKLVDTLKEKMPNALNLLSIQVALSKIEIQDSYELALQLAFIIKHPAVRPLIASEMEIGLVEELRH